MEERILTPRPHQEGIYRPDQPRAAGIYDEVRPAPVPPRIPVPAPQDPDD